jgi:DNA topoisomerase-1
MVGTAEFITVDPARSAEQAGLVYVTDDEPGITRRAGKGFVYRDVNGGRISDRHTLDRLRHLAVPPACLPEQRRNTGTGFLPPR